MPGGFDFEAVFEGSYEPSLTLGYCEPWCGTEDFCECYCGYQAAGSPRYEVTGHISQGWVD